MMPHKENSDADLGATSERTSGCDASRENSNEGLGANVGEDFRL